MRIKSVQAKNFRSYKSLSWALPDSGLTLIDGQNLDTGRSNMTGKCLAKGTPVLMYSGLIKAVEDIAVGDLLMGPDSKSRKVKTLARGRERLYKITPSKGESYTVNESHILSLKWIGGPRKGQILNIAVRDYLNLPKDSKRLLYGYRASVDFENAQTELPIDPYFLGAWLGDGHSEVSAITTADFEIADFVTAYAEKMGDRVLIHGKHGQKCRTYSLTSRAVGDAKVLSLLFEAGLIGNKHIPHRYKTASRACRLSLLAGILDTDGYLNPTGTSFEYVSKSRRLADDVCFVARSLGYCASLTVRQKYVNYKNRKVNGDYCIVHIGGDLSQIPVKIKRKQHGVKWSVRNPLHTAIHIEALEEGDYYGFEIEGPDRLFLLGDFTVTHNTSALDSIFWCLYGYLPKWGGPKGGTADAVIHRGEKKCHVTVEVEHDGSTFIIERERPAKFRIYQNGKPVDGKTSDLEDRLPEMIGMDANQFLISVYVSQDRTSSFFTMSDTDRTKLLSTIAGLDNLNKGLEKAKSEKAKIEQLIFSSQTSIRMLQSELDRIPQEIEEAMGALLQTEKEADQLIFDLEIAEKDAEAKKMAAAYEYELELKKISDKQEQDVVLLESEFARLSELKKQVELQLSSSPQPEPELVIEVNRLLKEFNEAKSHNQRVQMVMAQNLQARVVIGAIAEQLEKGDFGDVCGECGQVISPDNVDAHVDALLKRADQWEQKLKPEEPLLDLDAIDAKYKIAYQKLAQRTAELEAAPKQLKSDLSNIESKMSQISREAGMIKSMFESEANKLKLVLDVKVRQAFDDAKALQAQKQVILTKAQALNDAITKCNERRARLTVDRMELEKKEREFSSQLDEIMDLIDLFGPKGFRSVCFDGIIERISDRAAELLRLMTDDIYSTRIEQQGETAKGEARVILKPVITKGGIDVPLDDLSGGARRMVMLAYDVAVSEAVGDSSVLFLDEALDGLDAQGKAEAMRLLEEVSRVRAVFLVDHTSEIKSAVQNVITVKYKNGVSQMEGQEKISVQQEQEEA